VRQHPLQQEISSPDNNRLQVATAVQQIMMELNKQLQDLYIDVPLLSQTHFKTHETFFIPNYHLCRTDCCPGRKGRTAVAVRKGIPHNHVDLPLLVSIEATGVCILIGNSEVIPAAVYKSPGHAWSDADITELLSFSHKLLLLL
jgi:hypothetical protein